MPHSTQQNKFTGDVRSGVAAIAFVGRAGEACSESAWMIPRERTVHMFNSEEHINVELLAFFRGASSDARGRTEAR
jgi:hypothetical protein